ncbi:MlaD family protein [Sedimentitalea sp. HM32M-2]|uniref:MlaD family protein n=1 Tax=Sedimentitalea sp. HM32M-2 TaxID=3351566 RepID=UPI0036390CA4
MTEEATPAEMQVQAPRRSPWRNISIVWLVPVLALAVSLAVAWRSYSERGVLIEILFENAAGVTAGETTVRYRDVVIGLVEKVGFSDDLKQVRLSVRVDRPIAPFLDASAQFWVVRPEVSAEGVSGLSTVLSGVYIEGAWDTTRGPPLQRFTGLEQRPLIDLNEKGTRIVLRAGEGRVMAAGSPVFYRGVKVGRTEAPRLDETGSVVLVDAFVEAPHDRLLTTATRFWDTSGFSLSFGAGGLKLDVGSFAALISGGVAFNTFFSGGRPVKPGRVYDLHADEATARENAFSRVSSNTVTLATVFRDGVSGLSAGSGLFFRGIKIGEVVTISAFVAGDEDSPEVHQQVTLLVDPKLIGLPARATLEEVLDFLEAAVRTGTRARLNKANLLGTSLIVELVEIENAKPAELQREATPYALIPSVESDLPDINATLEGVMKRVNGLQIEEMIQQAISLMASIEAIATDQNTRAAPEALVGLLDRSRDLVESADMRALPGELRQAVADLRSTVERINTQGVVERLVSTLENADAAVANLSLASEEVPALIDDLRAVAAKARDLKADELIASATALLDSADALIGTDDARALPAALTTALDETRELVSELRAGGVAQNANAALDSARAAADSLERATADLPALSARLDRLVTRSEELIAAYGDRSDFNSESLAMLREIRTAARSVAALTRALERNPNSILFGK